MKVKHHQRRVLLLCLVLFTAMTVVRLAGARPKSASATASSLRGTWSGTFFSRHSDVSPFSMTLVITENSQGHVIGDSTLNADCFKGAPLQVTTNGANVVLAGSDEEGDSLTVRGNLDATSTQLNATYIMNGSASGRCETDNGTGSLVKQ
jgi:hypothetical protein